MRDDRYFGTGDKDIFVASLRPNLVGPKMVEEGFSNSALSSRAAIPFGL